MGLLKLIVGLLVVLAIASPASAATLTVNVYDGYRIINATYNGYDGNGVYGTHNVNGLICDAFAGNYNGNDVGLLYCVDLNGHLPSLPWSFDAIDHVNDFTDWPQYGPGGTPLLRSNPGEVAYIVNHYGYAYTGLDPLSEARRGAVQVAIWTAAYGANFNVTYWDGVDQGYFNTIMADAAGKSEGGEWYEWTGGYGTGGQDMMRPVPEPASLLLLGTGLLGAGIFTRRRRKA